MKVEGRLKKRRSVNVRLVRTSCLVTLGRYRAARTVTAANLHNGGTHPTQRLQLSVTFVFRNRRVRGRRRAITSTEEQDGAGVDVAGPRFESTTRNNVIVASDSYMEFARGTYGCRAKYS